MIARSTRRGWGWTAVAAVAALMLGCSALTDGVKAQAAQAAAPAPVPATNPAAKPGVPGMQATTAPAAGTQEQLNQATYRVLARRVPAVALDTVPLVDVLDFLRDATGLNMAVNWRALEAAGVDQRAPVSLRLRDVSVEQALKLVLRQVGGGQVRLDYTVDRGVVIISTADELSQDVSAQAYDVADLLEQENPGNPSEAAGKLIQVIENSVAPDSWRSAHGTIGSMIRYGNKLVVTQTPANQRAVAQLLEALRGQGAVSHGTKGTGQLTPPSPTSVPATRGEQWQRKAEQIRTE